MHDDLEITLEHNDTAFAMHTSINYNNRVEKLEKMLLWIKILTKEMQMQYYTLASRQDNLDMLIYNIEANRDNLGHNLYYYKLKKVHIGNNSENIPDLHFYYRVIKIQNNNLAGMITMDHNVCSSLLISCTDENIADLAEMTYKERKED